MGLKLSWGLRQRFGGWVELLNPEVERTSGDAQFASDGRSRSVAIDVHLDGSVFKLLIVDTSLFPRSNHSAIELCPLPFTLSIKWGELHPGQVAQMGQMGYPGQAGQA